MRISPLPIPTAADYKPHWKGKVPIPDPQLRARPRGNIQWQCPFCGNMHSTAKGFWAAARIQCGRPLCRRRLRVGVGFTTQPDAPRWLWLGRWYRDLANRLNPIAAPHAPTGLQGRLYGTLDWRCPDCDSIHTDVIDFRAGSVTCTRCTHTWYVQLLFYAPGGIPKLIIPYDWSIYDVTEILAERTLAQASGESAGTSSPLVGHHCEDSH